MCVFSGKKMCEFIKITWAHIISSSIYWCNLVEEALHFKTLTGAIIIIKINESFVYEPNENKTVLWLESSSTCAPMVNRHFRIGKRWV